MTFIALVPSIYTNVKQYGAKGDGKTVTDGAITSGTPTLTSASAAFTVTDAGKQITVNGAAAAGANLNTTISAYVNATTVTLAVNAGTTVSAATVFYATDDSTAIGSARSAANAAGGGAVFYPAGTYISGNQPLYPNVCDFGAGVGMTTIKLKNGANTDLFSAQTGSINLSAAANSGSVGTLSRFALRGLTLDGNKANQTSGTSYPLRFYGYDYLLEDVEILNGYSGGMLGDWNGGLFLTAPSNQMVAKLNKVNIHDCNGIGLQFGGPHDSQFYGVNIWDTGSHAFHFAPNSLGTLLTQCHPYHLTQSVGAVSMLVEAQGIQFLNCEIEGSDTIQLAVFAVDCSVQGGQIFGNSGYAGTCIHLGQQAGDAIVTGQIKQAAGVALANPANACNINTQTRNGTSGTIKFRNESYNLLHISNYQTSGGLFVGNVLPSGTDLLIVDQSGQTSDSSLNTLSGIAVPYSNSTWAVDVYGNFTPLSLNTTNSITYTATSQVLTTGATISKAAGGVIHVTEAGNVTGIILANGFGSDEMLTVVNESAFTVTFATEATSHIAGSTGSNVVIAAKSKAIFWWDPNTSLWYL